jgi:hypothetical protein
MGAASESRTQKRHVLATVIQRISRPHPGCHRYTALTQQLVPEGENPTLPILVKCNPSDFTGDKVSLALGIERGVELVEGDEVFVWVSEQPHEENTLGQNGLVARGELVAFERSGLKATIKVRLHRRFDGKHFGMNVLVAASSKSEPARHLECRIGPRRHRLVWSLSSEEREFLNSVFLVADQQITANAHEAEITRILGLITNRVVMAGNERSGRNPLRLTQGDTELFEMLLRRWHDQNGVCVLCQREIPLRAENKLLQMSPDRVDSTNPHYDWQNIRLTHLASNLGKSDATLAEWSAYLDMIRR